MSMKKKNFEAQRNDYVVHAISISRNLGGNENQTKRRVYKKEGAPHGVVGGLGKTYLNKSSC